MRFFLKIRYDGTSFHGWQKLKNLPTVQASIENSISTLLSRPVHIHGCGRTDSGVHAQVFFAHLDLEPDETENLLYRLNRIIPSSIQILEFLEVPKSAHAQRDASKRFYCYKVNPQKDPFNFHYSYWYPLSLDISLLNEMAQLVKETSDFRAFTKTPKRQINLQCKIYEAYWIESDESYKFHICADHFLRGMIRILVANMLEIFSGRANLDEIKRGLKLGIKPKYFHIAPAHGLHLVNVNYPYLS